MANLQMMKEFIGDSSKKKKAAEVELPTSLPSISDARLPEAYNIAKQVLERCIKVDECAEWANKSHALASYARQSKDESLFNMAVRIKDRAIRRCGELLKEAPVQSAGRPAKSGPSAAQINKSGPSAAQITRNDLAKEAGLSKRQQKQALRVASVPEEEFEEAVEAERPASATELAERGTKKRDIVADQLAGRDPAEIRLSTTAQGHLRRLAEFASEGDPGAIVRGALPNERLTILGQTEHLLTWLEKLQRAAKGASNGNLAS